MTDPFEVSEGPEVGDELSPTANSVSSADTTSPLNGAPVPPPRRHKSQFKDALESLSKAREGAGGTDLTGERSVDCSERLRAPL